MSDNFSPQEAEKMESALKDSMFKSPFIEEEDHDEDQSSFFVGSVRPKREIKDDDSPEPKRAKLSDATAQQTYGGGPLEEYVPGTPYKYTKHERMPELVVNSQHHHRATENFLFSIREVVLPALLPYRDEDKEIGDTVKWLEANARIPPVQPTQFALIGSSGSGKSTTLNNILGQPDLANASSSSESVTQVPQIFNHGTQQETFRVEVFFANKYAIRNLVIPSIRDLITYVRSLASDEVEEEMERVSARAEAGRQIVDDLFSHQGGLQSLDDAEEFLENKSLLPAEGEELSESAVRAFLQEINDRAVSDEIDLNERRKIITARNIGELHANTSKFSERGAFAPIVSSTYTRFYSPLLSQGIEIADLPGFTDTNIHLRKTSLAYYINCPKVIVVINLERCMTTPDLKTELKKYIKLKGAENVILVIRGKETVEKGKNRWTKTETAHLVALEKSLRDAENHELGCNDEQAKAQTTAEIENLKREILEYKIAVRDRIVIDFFHQKEFQDRTGSGRIRVLTVANRCHEQHMLGFQKAVLSPDMTGIRELRAYMCETPSRDRVQAFARRSAKCLIKIKRVSIWADGPKMPPRDAAMALFEKNTNLTVDGYARGMEKAAKEIRNTMIRYSVAGWAENATNTMDGWAALYPARTQGVFVRQNGRHNPKLKGCTDKKPPTVSWTEKLLMVAEDDVIALLETVTSAIEASAGPVEEHINLAHESICHGLETLDTIGGANLDGVFELFRSEADTCKRDMQENFDQLKREIRSTTMFSITDEPCHDDSPIFVEEMYQIYAASMEKFPKGTKNLTKERMKYIKLAVTRGGGPYGKMAEEIFTKLRRVFREWADKANKRIEQMFQELRGVLFRSFDGKKMSDARRKEVAPAIKFALEKARAVLEADLKEYPSDIL